MTTGEAGKAKSCTPETVKAALRAGLISGFQAGKYWLIAKDAKFSAWRPLHDPRKRGALGGKAKAQRRGEK